MDLVLALRLRQAAAHLQHPLPGQVLDRPEQSGLALREPLRPPHEPSTPRTLPACVVDAGPVGKGVGKKPVGTVAARRGGMAGVDPATQALKKIWDTADQHKITLRTATFAVACERILTARQERGLYP